MSGHTSEIDHKYRTMVTIWFILLLSQFMFFGVVIAIKGEVFVIDESQPMLGSNPPIVIAFAFLAVTNLVLSFFLKRRLLDQAVVEQKPTLIQTGLVIACALCESISIIGVVLAVAFSYQYFYLWIALGIFGIFLHFPRRQQLIDASSRKVLK